MGRREARARWWWSPPFPIRGARPHRSNTTVMTKKSKSTEFPLHSVHQRLRNPTALSARHPFSTHSSQARCWSMGYELNQPDRFTRKAANAKWKHSRDKMGIFFLQNTHRIVLSLLLLWYSSVRLSAVVWARAEQLHARAGAAADISPAYQFNYCCHGSQALGKGQ